MRTRRILTAAWSGAVSGSAVGAAIAMLVLILAFLSGTTVVPKWEMSVFTLSVVYIIGFTLSGWVAGALSLFVSSRARAYAAGTLSALPFALIATVSYVGPGQDRLTYLLPALIWSFLVGGAVGLIMYSVRSES